jgi:diguanylate cyclase (GGDEF)-like protein
MASYSESPHLTWRLLQISYRLLLIMVPMYLFASSFLALFFAGELGTGTSILWAVVCLVVAGGWMLTARQFGAPAGRATFVVQGAQAVFAGVQALLFSWFAVVVFPHATVQGQLAITGFYAGLVTLGTVTLAPQPAAAAAWYLGLSVGTVKIIIDDARWPMVPAWAVVCSLSVVLGAIVVVYHRMFWSRLRAESEAAKQSQLVGLLLHDFEEGSQDWLWESNQTGTLKNVSPRLAAQFGSPADQIDGRSLVDLLAGDRSNLTEDENDEIDALIRALNQGAAFRELEVPARSTGHHRRWRLTAKPLFEGRTLVGWRGVGSDVTEVERLNNLNARLAMKDSLTGIDNRHSLMMALHDQLSPRVGERPLSLVLIDLQAFRLVNEGLGHEVGDQLLRDVALRLRGRKGADAFVARLGGDEFALVAPGVEGASLDVVLANLSSAADEPYLVEGHRIEVEFQIGVATFPRDAASATELLKCAELALHESKILHEGVPVVYVPTLGQRARDKVHLQGELKVALVQGQFELHYQPQVRPADQVLVGAEALVRWRHPERGLVSPAEFIPALEETGLIVPVGLWILETACREALGWPAHEKVAVNVSAFQFASRTFLESVKRVLEVTNFPPRRLELEITESVMAQDAKQVIQILNELRTLGISISLDDFGTGFSSLSYLRQLPLDKLKVDQSFVRVLGQDPKAAAIVKAVLDMTKTLGLKTTAEGVETDEQRQTLQDMGVDNIQGYFYSKPVPADGLRAFREKLQGGV